MATCFGVIGKQLYSIARTNGNKALELPFVLRLQIFYQRQFASQNLGKEIAVAAGGLKETAVEPKGLVAHKVEHGVHLAWIGEHLAMVSHPLAAFDLFCVFVCSGHIKIVEL